MNKPTPKEIKQALKDWVPANRLIMRPGWKTRGRPWSYGIRGVMFHHWAGTGDGGQEWMEARSGAYPFCNNTVRRDGRVMVISALSAWHSGLGGPWGRAGVPKDVAHLMVWGQELEGPLRSTKYGVDDMTDEQWESSVQVACAIRQVAGPEAFPNFQRVIRHGDWTDGTAGVATFKLPTVGRKNDVWRPTKDIRRMCNRAWREAGR